MLPLIPFLWPSPLHYISQTIILFAVRRIVPSTIIAAVTGLVTGIFDLYKTFGFFRTFKIIFRIREALKIRALPGVLKDILFRGTNPIAAETIYKVLDKDWK